MRLPAASGTLLPKRVPRIPENGPSTSIRSDPGSISNPAPVASSPSPYPVEVGASASCGIRMNEPNIPNPTRSVARLVISTGALTSVEMSASGCSVRRSSATQPARTISPAAISPSVFAEPQPQT